MSKKVLILSGSFRKGGNSDTLCDRFAEGARDAGNEVEKIFINDRNIGYCPRLRGLQPYPPLRAERRYGRDFKQNGGGRRHRKATPVYFYTMNGQMKTLIDRTVPRYEEISGKDFYFIVAAADSSRANMEKTLEGFRGFTADCLPDAHEKGVVYGTGAWQVGDIKSSPAMDEAYQMGRSVA